MVEKNTGIDAKLLRSRLINYKNPIYRNEPAWLEYYIELENNEEFTLNLCTDQVILILQSGEKEFIDSLEVSWGKNILLPKERDTIRVIDLFVNKQEGISEMNWINPDIIIFNCLTNPSKINFKDSINYIYSFKIEKDTNFNFKIE